MAAQLQARQLVDRVDLVEVAIELRRLDGNGRRNRVGAASVRFELTDRLPDRRFSRPKISHSAQIRSASLKPILQPLGSGHLQR
jgi:hypothetical protein